MDKSPDAFRTISEVAGDLDLPQHVLRFWETRFVQIKPLKRGGGRRYYRPDDIDLLKGIRHLLYGEGYTIRGVQRILKEQGVRFVTEVWQEGAPQPPPAGQSWDAEAPMGAVHRQIEPPAAVAQWHTEPPLDRIAAEDWTPEAEPETDDPSPYDEPAAHWPEAEAAWPEASDASPWADAVDEPASSTAAESLPASPVPSVAPAPAVAAPQPVRTPFAIGRATPLDPNFRPRHDAAAVDFEPRFDPADEAEDERATPTFAPRPVPRAPLTADPTPRPRAERIAGFTAAPQAVRNATFDPTAPRPGAEVTPLRPGVEPPPLSAGPARPSRLPAGLRPTSAAPEPQRSGIGQFFDRLRPAAALGGDAEEGAAPPLRSIQSLSRDEIRRLQSTLFELLECKRLLDQIR